MDGAAPLLLGLHGRLLRLVCAHAGCHFEGLAVAGRYLFKQGSIDTATKKKLLNLDVVAAFLRHVSEPLCEGIVASVRSQIKGEDKNKDEENEEKNEKNEERNEENEEKNEVNEEKNGENGENKTGTTLDLIKQDALHWLNEVHSEVLVSFAPLLSKLATADPPEELRDEGMRELSVGILTKARDAGTLPGGVLYEQLADAFQAMLVDDFILLQGSRCALAPSGASPASLPRGTKKDKDKDKKEKKKEKKKKVKAKKKEAAAAEH
jgi:ribosomal protein L12E/L44/L45/RPP1/RPP2